MIVVGILAWLAVSGAHAPTAPDAVEVRLHERMDRLRADAGAPALDRMPELDAAARARAAEIAALPMAKRLDRRDSVEALLRSRGIRRIERAEARVAILGGYEDPAAEAIVQWSEGPDSRLLDRRWTAAGAGAARAPDGVVVIVALLFQEAAAPPDLRALEREVERAVNEERKARGLQPLAFSDALRAIARAHSEDMARRGYFDHVSPEGLAPAQRVRKQGLEYRKVSENIAKSLGQEAPVRSAVDGWLASPGHFRNMTDPEVSQTGVGIASDEDGALYFTQLFFDPMAP